MAYVRKAVLIGSGSSSSVPKLNCVTSGSSDAPTKAEGAPKGMCDVCRDALKPGSKNNRLNPMFYIEAIVPKDAKLADDDDANVVETKTEGASITGIKSGQEPVSIDGDADGEADDDIPEGMKKVVLLIDCTKTFRESMMKMIRMGCCDLSKVDGLMITHDHADACMGLDDLREFSASKHPIQVFVDDKLRTSMQRVFPYLFSGAVSWVASIQWRTIVHNTSFNACGLPITVFPVIHGKDYLSNAFAFKTADGGHIVYISDVSSLPEETLRIVDGFQPIHVLILDLLSKKDNPTHFSQEQSLAAAKRIKAKRTVFTGMSHLVDYEKLKDELKVYAETKTSTLEERDAAEAFEPGYDGQVVWGPGSKQPGEKGYLYPAVMKEYAPYTAGSASNVEETIYKKFLS